MNKASVVIVELGGNSRLNIKTACFFEANRIMKLQMPKDVIHVHVSYLPVIKSIGELKSKPTQQSVHVLNSLGIQPDLLIAWSEQELDERRRERLALFCNIHSKDIIANPALTNIYEVPLFMEEQGLSRQAPGQIGDQSSTQRFKKMERICAPA